MNIEEELLKPPVARAAYSDRMAWLMAEMSKLAYHKFEQDKTYDEFVDTSVRPSDKDAISEETKKYNESIEKLSIDGCQILNERLSEFKFELVSVFDSGGTQAFLAKRDLDKIVVLAFRGTELDFRDFKTQVDVRFYRHDGVRIYNGYHKAFQNVESSIRLQLKELSSYRLYITGHSLGGALALVATRALNSDNIAACYTYGSPKVGNSEFGDAIKPPIYRIVNAADMAPRWPVVPHALFIEFLSPFSKLIPIPSWRSWVNRSLFNFGGYAHHGDMRYLTACKSDFSDLRVIPNLNGTLRTIRLLRRLSTDFKVGVTDHSIATYCDKLKVYAIKRINQK